MQCLHGHLAKLDNGEILIQSVNSLLSGVENRRARELAVGKGVAMNKRTASVQSDQKGSINWRAYKRAHR